MKSLLVTAIIFTTALVTSVVKAGEAQAIAACTHTANAYAHFRDQLMYEEYGNLFTEDAVFSLMGNDFVGRDKIVKALKVRGPTELTRHMSHVVHMEVVAKNELKGISYLTLYAAPLKKQKRPYTNQDNQTGNQKLVGTKPHRVSGPKLVGEYHDTFRLDKKGNCKIAKRRVEVLFLMNTP